MRIARILLSTPRGLPTIRRPSADHAPTSQRFTQLRPLISREPLRVDRLPRPSNLGVAGKCGGSLLRSRRFGGRRIGRVDTLRRMSDAFRRLARAATLSSAGLSVFLCAFGCASAPQGAAFVTVPADRYQSAFEAACAFARDEGFVPEVTDLEIGAIESLPRYAGSALEPWAWTDMTGADVASGTIGFERRRLRVEFVAAGFRPVASNADAPLAGPVLPGSERPVGGGPAMAEGALEIRLSVSVERRFQPGYQGSAYTRALGSTWRDTTERDGDAPRDRSIWTPVARDERLERVLTERLAARLGSL